MSRWGASGRQYALASPHHLATRAGARLLAEGGTAVDAALAAAAVLTVVYPNQCAVGGDVIALLAEPGSDPVAVNGSGAAPRDVDVSAVRARHGGRMPWYGADAVTVPGAVSAWWQLHRRGGRRPWSDVLAPAIVAADEGVPVAPGLARALVTGTERVLADPGLSAVMTSAGEVLNEGQTLRQPALARSLRAIADAGPAALYEGELGDALVTTLRAHGSAMTVDDLTSHTCEVTRPVGRSWRDERWLVAPPNSQGYVLLQLLGALERAGANDPLGDDADLLSALFAATSAERDARLADPQVAVVDVDALLDPSHLEDLLAEARRRAERPRPAPLPPRESGRPPSGDTVAVVAADAEGRFVSLIQSVYLSFGSGILDPVTGILLHDRGACFSLDPRSPNVLRAGARPAHTLMPVLVEREGVVVGAHGTRGGEAQPQIHAQVALHLAGGLQPEAAVAQPRWIIGPADDESTVDEVLAEDDLPTPAAASLARFATGPDRPVLHRLPALDDEVGHINVVRLRDGRLLAGSDPRSDGSALAD
jgi:oxamate amidohydrolase